MTQYGRPNLALAGLLVLIHIAKTSLYICHHRILRHVRESEPYCHHILFVCVSGCLSVILRPTAYHD